VWQPSFYVRRTFFGPNDLFWSIVGENWVKKSRDLTASQVARLTDEAIEQVTVRILPDGRMSRQDAARYLGHKPKTLAMWTLFGKGPRSLKVGGKIFYFRCDLDAFVRGGEGA
jgi:hypothetical protein